MPLDNSGCLTVNNGEQQIFMMSGNPAYGTANEHCQQPTSQKNYAYISVNRQVAVLGKACASLHVDPLLLVHMHA